MSTPIDYLLHLADNAVVLGQRNAEWCGHGPILEEDMALANVSLDLIGQARCCCTSMPPPLQADGRRRHRGQAGLLPRPARVPQLHAAGAPAPRPLVGYAAADRDYATTIVRNFLYSALMVLVWDGLQQSVRPSLAAIAAKSLKEDQLPPAPLARLAGALGRRHRRVHARAQAAVDHLMPYTEEFWTTSPAEGAAVAGRRRRRRAALRPAWDALVNDAWPKPR